MKPKQKDGEEPDKDAGDEFLKLREFLGKVEEQVIEMLKFCKTMDGGIDLMQLAYSVVSGYFPNLEVEMYEDAAKNITGLQEIGEYKEDDTPFDWYDSECHNRTDKSKKWF